MYQLFIVAIIALFAATKSFAYLVGFSLADCSTNAYFALNTWSNVCARADEDDNFLGGWTYDPLNPDQVDGSCNNQQWQVIINHCGATDSCGIGWARSNVSRNTNIVDATAYPGITNLLGNAFANAAQYGYSYDRVGFYDNALTLTSVTNGVTNTWTQYYNWDTTEVQYMRNWLDGNGYTNVVIDYDARNNGAAVRSWCATPVVSAVLLEANATKWFTDYGSRQELLQWLTTNPATASKKIIFQAPPDGTPNPYGVTNNIMAARQLMVWMGNFMGYDFMRRTNVAFHPVTYTSPVMQFFPEMTPDGGHYTNTMTSLTLALIEQRAFFEGRCGVLPTMADADNLIRNPYPTISALAGKTGAVNTATAPIPFSLGSQSVPGAALTVTANSSSPSLVANSNIIITTWVSTNLGSVGITSSKILGDVITMNASGTDISGTADSGSFIYQPLSGDGALVARVTSLQPANAWSRAGVMMRASTNAGSANCFMQVTASNGVAFSWRAGNAGNTTSNKVAGITAPCWLKLLKTGTNFAGYYATNNAGAPGPWVQVGSTIGVGAMSNNLLSGLAGTAHNNTALGTFVFDNISGNTNRSMTIMPTANQSGIATIQLAVSDGWYSAVNTFNLTVPTTGQNTAPTISNLTNNVSMIESSATSVPFNVSDAQSAADALWVTGYSSNPGLVPNANLVFSGSGSNRTVTLTPVPLQIGSATIGLVVSDGTLNSTNTFALTVAAFKPPVISNLPTTVTVVENSTTNVSFTVNDLQVPANSLTVSGVSSSQWLVFDDSLVFGGNGSNRTVTLTPNVYQIGTNTISLVVSDGLLTGTNSFLLNVVPPGNYHTAVTSGDINDPATWGGTVPVTGDTNIWQTGGYTINMSGGAGQTFYGKVFVVQTGGKFSPGIANADLTLSNLVLAGGSIVSANNGGMTMNLSKQTFTLISGTLQSSAGQPSFSRNILFQNGSLAGSGMVDVIGSATYTNYVQFQSTINTTNFTGDFSVHDNGTLYLPAITLTNASFGLILTNTGQYQNAANVALTSLMIDGTNIPPGIYAFTNFNADEQSFLVMSNSTITVVTVTPTYPMLAPIADQTLVSGQTLLITNVATDADYPPPALTYSLVGSPDGLNGVPSTMTINPTNGILTWRPTIADSVIDTITIGVQVSNNGNPPLITEQDFGISVNPPANPGITNLSFSHGSFSLTIMGDTGPDYVLQSSTNLTIWKSVKTNYSPIPPFSWSISQSATQAAGYFRVQLQP